MRYRFEEMRAMSDETTAEMLAEIDRDLADIEKAVSALQQQAAQANYPQQVETTTDRLAEIEGQAGAVTSADVAAEALAGVHEWPNVQTLQRKLETTEAALLEQQQRNEELVTQGSQQRMQIAELQAQVRFLKNRELTLGTRLEEEKAVTTKRLQQVEELRSEVSHVQGLLGESSRRVSELETLVKDLRAVNAAQEKAVNSEARDKADLQHRLDVVSSEWAQQAETMRGLRTQLEAVKAELVQVSKDRQALQIELDAREQVPQAVSDRFEEGWDAGTARAVETIAEWTEPFRTCGSQSLALAVLQNLPHIMRSLTGLTDED